MSQEDHKNTNVLHRRQALSGQYYQTFVYSLSEILTRRSQRLLCVVQQNSQSSSFLSIKFRSNYVHCDHLDCRFKAAFNRYAKVFNAGDGLFLLGISCRFQRRVYPILQIAFSVVAVSIAVDWPCVLFRLLHGVAAALSCRENFRCWHFE